MRTAFSLNQGLPANSAARDRVFRPCADASVTDGWPAASLVPSLALLSSMIPTIAVSRDWRDLVADNALSCSDPDKVGPLSCWRLSVAPEIWILDAGWPATVRRYPS